MPPLKLSLLSVALGLAFGLPNIYGVLKPATFGARLWTVNAELQPRCESYLCYG